MVSLIVHVHVLLGLLIESWRKMINLNYGKAHPLAFSCSLDILENMSNAAHKHTCNCHRMTESLSTNTQAATHVFNAITYDRNK
eukprot:3293015-Amphidinium_carterae.1